MKKIISFLLLFAFGLSGCEKDDICDANTPTTPRLIITFYDINNPTVRKKVTNLKVIGLDQDEGIIFNEAAIDEAKYVITTDSIAVPLKTDAETTTYDFILNSGNPNASSENKDRIKFNYTHQETYVSRACGFKSIFQSLTLQRTDPNADGLWMQNIFIINPNIEYENGTHIKVFF
ncbi:DUF6452 family protein [Flavobacterium sp. HTF]|uniref:DUF6452 family protein n=1 Tax=Flavobacterium sp. HTF TaxID=2170732 RepID=UPI000D5F8ECE|nr:DUF6452 family protein [Flavobacterium sp. HTF]PWB25734.1 hypothetical protein DCO46_07880 [Flavobacterium sp. HTF]